MQGCYNPPLNAAHMNLSVNNLGAPQISRRRIIAAGMAAGWLCSGLPSAFAGSLPDPQTELWTDAARSRELPVLLRWPNEKPKGVMIYSHGLGGKKEGGDFWGKAWSAAGLLVVHLQHPGSDGPSLKGGYPALRTAMAPEQLIARMKDVRFAVAEINRRHASGAGTWGAVPTEKMAVGGHSFGARTTMLTAGWQRNGISGSDPQPKAFVALSPALSNKNDLAQSRKEMAAVTRPFLVCTGSLDGEVLNNGETPETRRMVYEAMPAGKKALLWLDGADHFTFAGNEKLVPSTFIARREKATMDLEAAQHELVARISTAWLKEQLFGQMMGAVSGLGVADQFLRA
jgi:predicted dienelactone hydrolase